MNSFSRPTILLAVVLVTGSSLGDALDLVPRVADQWEVNLVSGMGPEGLAATSIALRSPAAVVRELDGNLFVADRNNYRVLRVTPAGLTVRIAGTGERCTDAGGDSCGDGGPATSAGLGAIHGMAIDSFGHVYLADTDRNRIRKIDATSGIIETVVNIDGVECAVPTAPIACGDGGTAAEADLDRPRGLAFDSQDRLYIADSGDGRVRRVSTHSSTRSVEPGSTIETVVGSGRGCFAEDCGDGAPATLAATTPWDVAIQEDGATVRVYISDVATAVDRVREAIVGGNIQAFAGPPGDSGVFFDCGPPTDYDLQGPKGLDVDAEGNVYIADSVPGSVMRVDASTGMICHLAGNGSGLNEGGPGCDTVFDTPVHLTVDRSSNDLFIADTERNRVRKLSASDGVIHECENPNSQDNLIHTVAGTGKEGFSGDGGPANAAPIGGPRGVAFDDRGNILIAARADPFKHIYRVDADTGMLAIIAGTGQAGFAGGFGQDAMAAKFEDPHDLAVDDHGNVFVADRANNLVRKITPDGRIWTVAGVPYQDGFDGDTPRLAVEALLDGPLYLAVDRHNNVYVSSALNDRIRRIDAVGGEVDPAHSMITTVAGGGASTDYENPAGVPVEAIELRSPSGLAIGPDDTLYFANRSGTYRVFALPEAHTANVQMAGMHVAYSIAGSESRCPSASSSGFDPCGDGGPAASAALGSPEGLAYDPETGDIYVGDSRTRRLRRLHQSSGAWQIEGLAGNSSGTSQDRFAGDGGPAADARLYYPTNVAVAPNGDVVFADSRNDAFRRVDADTGIITTFAGQVFPRGDRELAASELAAPHALVRRSATEWLIADGWSGRVRQVDPTPVTGSVSTVAGYRAGFTDDGAPALYSRMLLDPTGIAWDGRRFVYVAETGNHVIRRIDTSRTPWTIEHWAGTEGVPGPLNEPSGLAIDTDRRRLYVADTGNHVVRSIDLADPSRIRTVAGIVGDEGDCDTGSGDASGSTATRLRSPVALAMDSVGHDGLSVVDAGCHMVRRIDLSSRPPRSSRVIGDGLLGDPAEGIAASVRLREPRGAAVDRAGNLFVTSRAHVVVVAAGIDRRADGGDRVQVIYGDNASAEKFSPWTRCLTDVAVADPATKAANEVYVLDRCSGFMLRLKRGP